MPKQFPQILHRLWSRPDALRGFISDIEPTNPNGCPNCNGAGFFVGSIAVAGPYESPTTTAKVFHYFDQKWWEVVSLTADCPVCLNGQNNHKKVEYVKKPTDVMDMLATKLKTKDTRNKSRDARRDEVREATVAQEMVVDQLA